MFSIKARCIARTFYRTLTSCPDPEIYKSLQLECRKFAKNVLEPVASELDRNQSFPYDQIKDLGKLGLMGITVPKKYGGSGLDIMSASIVVEELSRACAATGAIISIHNMLYADFVANHGTEEQKEIYLRPYTKGIPGSFALSEADAGSDVANISTEAIKNGEYYTLNGNKSWVTSAMEAEIAIVFATVNKSANSHGITAFLVSLKEEGVRLSQPDRKLGIRALSTCDISLNNVIVPATNIVGEIGGGFKLALHQLNKARIGIASQAIGIAQASLDTALNYAHSREAFGKRILDMQAVQLRLARMATQVEASRLLVRKAAEQCANNSCIIKSSAIAKLMASETATFSAHQCIQILGAMGYVNSMPAERFYRDARVTEIYGGVSDIQMLTIADQLIKEIEK